MSLTRVVVTAVRIEGRSKSAVAREYKISPRWVHELVRRFDAEGEAGLAVRCLRRLWGSRRVVEVVGSEVVVSDLVSSIVSIPTTPIRNRPVRASSTSAQ